MVPFDHSHFQVKDDQDPVVIPRFKPLRTTRLYQLPSPPYPAVSRSRVHSSPSPCKSELCVDAKPSALKVGDSLRVQPTMDEQRRENDQSPATWMPQEDTNQLSGESSREDPLATGLYQTTEANTYRGVQLQSSQPASLTLYSLAGSLKSSDSDHQLPTANAHQVTTQHLATADPQSPVWWKNTLLDKRNREEPIRSEENTPSMGAPGKENASSAKRGATGPVQIHPPIRAAHHQLLKIVTGIAGFGKIAPSHQQSSRVPNAIVEGTVRRQQEHQTTTFPQSAADRNTRPWNSDTIDDRWLLEPEEMWYRGHQGNLDVLARPVDSQVQTSSQAAEWTRAAAFASEKHPVPPPPEYWRLKQMLSEAADDLEGARLDLFPRSSTLIRTHIFDRVFGKGGIEPLPLSVSEANKVVRLQGRVFTLGATRQKVLQRTEKFCRETITAVLRRSQTLTQYLGPTKNQQSHDQSLTFHQQYQQHQAPAATKGRSSAFNMYERQDSQANRQVSGASALWGSTEVNPVISSELHRDAVTDATFQMYKTPQMGRPVPSNDSYKQGLKATQPPSAMPRPAEAAHNISFPNTKANKRRTAPLTTQQAELLAEAGVPLTDMEELAAQLEAFRSDKYEGQSSTLAPNASIKNSSQSSDSTITHAASLTDPFETADAPKLQAMGSFQGGGQPFGFGVHNTPQNVGQDNVFQGTGRSLGFGAPSMPRGGVQPLAFGPHNTTRGRMGPLAPQSINTAQRVPQPVSLAAPNLAQGAMQWPMDRMANATQAVTQPTSFAANPQSQYVGLTRQTDNTAQSFARSTPLTANQQNQYAGRAGQRNNTAQAFPQPLPFAANQQSQYSGFQGPISHSGILPSQMQLPQQQPLRYPQTTYAASQPLAYRYPLNHRSPQQPASGYSGPSLPQTHPGYNPAMPLAPLTANPYPGNPDRLVRPPAPNRIAPLYAQTGAWAEEQSQQSPASSTALVQCPQCPSQLATPTSTISRDHRAQPYRTCSDDMYPISTTAGPSVRYQHLNAFGVPRTETAMNSNNFPFEETAKATKPAEWGIMKIGNIPYNVTRAGIASFLGPRAKIITADLGPSIHILMDRMNGKTLDCFVELSSTADARMWVNIIKSRPKSANRIADRLLEVHLSSQGELMKELFPKAKSVLWDGGNPIIVEPEELYNSGFKTFVTLEELNSLTKHAEQPRRSTFTMKSPSRPYEAMISLLYKFPWYATEHYTLATRNNIFNSARRMILILDKQLMRSRAGSQASQHSRASSNAYDSPLEPYNVGNMALPALPGTTTPSTPPKPLSEVLLKSLIHAGLNAAGFSEKQRWELSQIGQFGFRLSPLAQYWPFEVVGRKAGMEEDVVEWYANLISSHYAVQESIIGSPFGDLSLFFPESLEEYTTQQVGELEWDTLIKIVEDKCN